MQHTHISLRYPIPGLSIDSALPCPTLPRGPPLATLAPTNIQLLNICKVSVNQKLAKPLSQLGILEITLDFEKLRRFCKLDLFLMPRSDPNPKLQNHFKIQNLTSNFKISKNKRFDVLFDVFSPKNK